MPIANIQMMEGRTAEQKTQLIRKVTDAIMEALDAPEGNPETAFWYWWAVR
jgi:4-oxalocrotonate tautomerase